MNDLIFEIGLILNDLPRSERAFAQAVIESPSALEGATLQKLAYDTGTSDATIIRFCKRLGFSGINDFKIAITEAGKTCQNVDGHLFSNLDTTDIMKEVYRSTLYILNDTMAQATDKYDKAVMSLLNAQSINFFGIGEAYITCMYVWQIKVFKTWKDVQCGLRPLSAIHNSRKSWPKRCGNCNIV